MTLAPKFLPGIVGLVKLWTWRLNWRALIVVIAAAAGYLVAAAVRDIMCSPALVFAALERFTNRTGRVLERALRRRPQVVHTPPPASPDVLAPERPGTFMGNFKISSISRVDEDLLRAAIESENTKRG